MDASYKKHLNPTDTMLRQFALLWVVFLGAIAVRQQLHGRHILAIVLTVLAVTIGPAGLIWPRTIRPVFVGWMTLVYPIGWFVSRVVLGAIFYGLFTPVAWLSRMLGRDALLLRRKPHVTTYWGPKPAPSDSAQYLRQF
jgi:hypothetical protein